MQERCCWFHPCALDLHFFVPFFSVCLCLSSLCPPDCGCDRDHDAVSDRRCSMKLKTKKQKKPKVIVIDCACGCACGCRVWSASWKKMKILLLLLLVLLGEEKTKSRYTIHAHNAMHTSAVSYQLSGEREERETLSTIAKKKSAKMARTRAKRINLLR